MRIRFDPGLVEEAVHLLAQTDPRRWRAYRGRIDPLYDRPDRDAAIGVAMLAIFRRWRAAAPCEEALARAGGCDEALVVRSQRPGDEGADLLVGEQRTVLFRIAADRFLDPCALATFVRHEMRHVLDMLDPAFGYRPDLGLRGRTRAEQELVRSRYRVLWDLAIDHIETPPLPLASRLAEVDRSFGALDQGQRARLVARFDDPAVRAHETLTAAARDPWTFLGESRRSGPAPGQPCPLCGFPTHDWEKDPPVAAIRRDYPDWGPSHGACGQCADIYRVRTANAGT